MKFENIKPMKRIGIYDFRPSVDHGGLSKADLATECSCELLSAIGDLTVASEYLSPHDLLKPGLEHVAHHLEFMANVLLGVPPRAPEFKFLTPTQTDLTDKQRRNCCGAFLRGAARHILTANAWTTVHATAFMVGVLACWLDEIDQLSEGAKAS